MEALSDKLYRLQLPNGHRFLAFVPGRLRGRLAPATVGSTLRVRLSPYDLSVGCVVQKEETKS